MGNDELRKLAAAKMAQEKPDQTLQATALVHEAYMVYSDSPCNHFVDRRRTTMSCKITSVCLLSVLAFGPTLTAPADVVTFQNDLIRVDVDKTSGCFTVVEKVTGQTWVPDPWDGAAAVLRVRTANHTYESWNLSKCRTIEVVDTGDRSVQVTFQSPTADDGQVVDDLSVVTQLRLSPDTADLDLRVLNVTGSGTYYLADLIYPARHFHLRSEVDRGMAVIPYHSGVVVPSHLFPLPSSQFGEWTDWHHQGEMIFEFQVYGDLRMPWYGIHSSRSGVMTILPRDGSVDVQYVQNYNDRARILIQTGQESTRPSILALSPVWRLNSQHRKPSVRYHFVPYASYVKMAKHYRSTIHEEGILVSLRDKAKKTPEVHQMIGDIYLHIFGGYPHRVNDPGMAFTFDQVEAIADDLHHNLQVKKAFLTLWGTWENYPPTHWPVNQAAGGQDKLVQVIEKIKSYGYLVTPYHNFNCMLPWDPKFTTKYYARDENGKVKYNIVWNMLDDKYAPQLAMDVLQKEMEVLKPNAIYTDCKQGPELRAFLQKLNLPITSERTGDSELLIPEYHRLEGVVPDAFKDPRLNFLEVPLFNLVYHDAVLLSNRWQWPDNEYSVHGDYAVWALRNMIYGNETMYVTPAWAYPGIRPYIRNAVRVLAPLHEETGFEELANHEFLSADFNLQRSTFGNGTVVTVNLGLLDQTPPDGTTVPGLGFRIRHADGSRTDGQFKITLELHPPVETKEILH